MKDMKDYEGYFRTFIDMQRLIMKDMKDFLLFIVIIKKYITVSYSNSKTLLLPPLSRKSLHTFINAMQRHMKDYEGYFNHSTANGLSFISLSGE